MRILDDFTNCENGVRLDGKVAIVTGATSGTGLETAKNLAKRGAKVIIASRSPAKLSDAKKNIIRSSGNKNVIARTMDFESLKSVRNFAQEMYLSEPRLDILINNIGAIALEDRLTSDSLHLMMQVNYFGAFLLTFLLYPLMRSSAPSRIVNVSSIALLLGHIDLKHMNDVGKTNIEYYANAKLADILFTVEMHKRIEGNGVNVYSMDPGLGKSEFFRNSNETFWKTVLNTGLLIVGRPLDRVATMPVFLAVDPRVEKASGKHFRDCAEFYSSWFSNDIVLTKRLWEESKRLVQITPEEDWEQL
ncbi:retinol dehydrogenase 13-like [Nymphalis io]|uniref:retinol dehydrogenase 13-like n=1 Tax=Inachis io TaxID=171585 RepID=UPI00216A8933|nr:retinol dehydrogenase 13-like [Nymphalis io]